MPLPKPDSIDIKINGYAQKYIGKYEKMLTKIGDDLKEYGFRSLGEIKANVNNNGYKCWINGILYLNEKSGEYFLTQKFNKGAEVYSIEIV